MNSDSCFEITHSRTTHFAWNVVSTHLVNLHLTSSLDPRRARSSPTQEDKRARVKSSTPRRCSRRVMHFRNRVIRVCAARGRRHNSDAPKQQPPEKQAQIPADDRLRGTIRTSASQVVQTDSPHTGPDSYTSWRSRQGIGTRVALCGAWNQSRIHHSSHSCTDRGCGCRVVVDRKLGGGKKENESKETFGPTLVCHGAQYRHSEQSARKSQAHVVFWRPQFRIT